MPSPVSMPKLLETQRTIFIGNTGVPIHEIHSDEHLKWVTIPVKPADKALSDQQLLDIILERVKTGEFTVTDKAMHTTQPRCVSYPVIEKTGTTEHPISCILSHQLDILKGAFKVDRAYLFNDRSP